MRLIGRRREIIELASRGMTDKAIAVELGVTVGTVQSHWKHIRSSYGSSSRAAIVADFVVSSSGNGELCAQEELKVLRDRTSELESRVADLAALAGGAEGAESEAIRLLANQTRLLRSSLAALELQAEEMGHLCRLAEMNNVAFFRGEWGGNWRKFYVTEAIRFTGIEQADWIANRLSPLDVCLEEEVPGLLRRMGHAESSGEHAAFAYHLCPQGRLVRVLELHQRVSSGDQFRPSAVGVCLAVGNDTEQIVRALCGLDPCIEAQE